MPTLVSVVIPSFNGGQFLGHAIDSVLAQTHPAVEIIVVDDGSVDDTRGVVEAYGARVGYLRQENRGPAAARNAGMRVARGPYLAFLDHDDRFLPEKLARQAAVLDARPEVGAVYTGWHFIGERGQRLPPTGWPRSEGQLLGDLVLENLIFPAAALVRRDLIIRAGGFDEARAGLEDWDMWLRLSRAGLCWACVDEPLLEYRLHPGQRHKHGTARRLSNRLAILEQVFADADLPPEVRALEPRAYQNAYLQAAADYYRQGMREEGRCAFHAAVRFRPGFLTESRSLRHFCRLLMPTGFQRQAMVASNWRTVTRTLRTAIADVHSRPDLEPEIARVRWRARLTVLRVTTRLLRKRLLAAGAPWVQDARLP